MTTAQKGRGEEGEQLRDAALHLINTQSSQESHAAINPKPRSNKVAVNSYLPEVLNWNSF